jgi:hypothetical protein
LRAVRATAAAARRLAGASARWITHVVARLFRAVTRFAATTGRDCAVSGGRATAAGAAAFGGAVAAAGSRGWSTAQVWTPRAWRRSVAATRSFARQTRSTTSRARVRIEPLLRRAWAVWLVGMERAASEMGSFATSASKRVSAYIDSRSRPR